MKFRENFATAATCHCLLLTVPTECLITLSTYAALDLFSFFFAIIREWLDGLR